MSDDIPPRLCAYCGKKMERNGLCATHWKRKKFCSRDCNIKNMHRIYSPRKPK